VFEGVIGMPTFMFWVPGQHFHRVAVARYNVFLLHARAGWDCNETSCLSVYVTYAPRQRAYNCWGNSHYMHSHTWHTYTHVIILTSVFHLYLVLPVVSECLCEIIIYFQIAGANFLQVRYPSWWPFSSVRLLKLSSQLKRNTSYILVLFQTPTRVSYYIYLHVEYMQTLKQFQPVSASQRPEYDDAVDDIITACSESSQRSTSLTSEFVHWLISDVWSTETELNYNSFFGSWLKLNKFLCSV